MPNDQLSADLIEAYTIAPTDIILIETLELQHPSFVDDSGDPTSVYIAINSEDVTCTVDGTPRLFVGMAVDFTLPEVKNDEQVEMTVTVDNVGRELMTNIESAIDDGSPITVIYRPYLSTDLTVAQRDPPITMQLADVTADQYRVQGIFRFDELVSRRFPNKVYTLEDFPGLATPS